MSKLILAIDQGTTGSTALLLDRDLRVRGRANREFRQIYPRPGWVEHEPSDILASVEASVKAALEAADAGPGDIAAIGITNQRETSLLWDRSSGEPLMNAIVWQDRRTEPDCRALKEAGHERRFKETTGLVLDPYFSGTKVRWMLDNVPGARARADRGDLAFGTIDTFLVSKLTGGRAHVTDVSNASRTLLLGLRTGGWDPALADLLGVPMSVLPRVASSSEVYGATRGLSWLPEGIPIAGMAGDQQSALFGQLCTREGMAKCTYGTGAFLMMNTGSAIVPSQSGLLTTVAWKLGDQMTYALEGSAIIAGAAVQWLRDGLGIIRSASEIEALARQVPDAGGVTFVPALAGLGAPHWRPNARGSIQGLSRGTTAAHLARATLEGIALQIRDLAAAMAQDLGRPMAEMRVDGGAAANDLLMQMQADYSGVRLVRPAMLETTALGAAFLAGLAVGVWRDLEDLRQAWQAERTFQPELDAGEREAKLAEWAEAVRRA